MDNLVWLVGKDGVLKTDGQTDRGLLGFVPHISLVGKRGLLTMVTISVLCTSVVDFTALKHQGEKVQNHISGTNITLIPKVKFGNENKP